MGLKDKDCPDVVVKEEEVEESKGSGQIFLLICFFIKLDEVVCFEW